MWLPKITPAHLRDIRNYHGLTQKDMASHNALDCGVTNIVRIEDKGTLSIHQWYEWMRTAGLLYNDVPRNQNIYQHYEQLSSQNAIPNPNAKPTCLMVSDRVDAYYVHTQMIRELLTASEYNWLYYMPDTKLTVYFKSIHDRPAELLHTTYLLDKLIEREIYANASHLHDYIREHRVREGNVALVNKNVEQSACAAVIYWDHPLLQLYDIVHSPLWYELPDTMQTSLRLWKQAELILLATSGKFAYPSVLSVIAAESLQRPTCIVHPQKYDASLFDPNFFGMFISRGAQMPHDVPWESGVREEGQQQMQEQVMTLLMAYTAQKQLNIMIPSYDGISSFVHNPCELYDDVLDAVRTVSAHHRKHTKEYDEQVTYIMDSIVKNKLSFELSDARLPYSIKRYLGKC